MDLRYHAIVSLFLVALIGGCDDVTRSPPASESGPGTSTRIATPQSLAAEHRELHDALARASSEGGAIGRAAAELERALAPHFKREEQIATPPLGLLPDLAHGRATAAMRAVLPMSEALERELPQMLREHEAIRRAAGRLRVVAQTSGREELVRFTDELAAHAQQEEEILYPTAIVVGRYVAATAPR